MSNFATSSSVVVTEGTARCYKCTRQAGGRSRFDGKPIVLIQIPLRRRCLCTDCIAASDYYNNGES